MQRLDRCQEREDGARVGGSGRSFARGHASNRRRRGPQRPEQRRVGCLVATAASARHLNGPAAFPAGALHSSWARWRATRRWSSSSSPPARESMSRTITGRALGPIGSPTSSGARYATRQLTFRQVHCAQLGSVTRPHARGRAAHRRRRRPRCPELQWVRPLCQM